MSREVKTRDGLYGLEFIEPDGRRVPAEDRKTPEIKQLWQRNHEIVSLAARGFKQVEIAEILSIHPQTVSNTLNSELGKYKLAELRRESDEEAKITVQKIHSLRNQALAVYNEILQNENGTATLKDRKDVADTVVLELSGLRVPTRVQSQHTSVTLTAEELEEFKRKGVQAARDSGMIIEAESKKLPSGNGNGSEPEADRNKDED